MFHVSHESSTFSKKFDDIQDKLHALAARDDLLTGLEPAFLLQTYLINFLILCRNVKQGQRADITSGGFTVTSL